MNDLQGRCAVITGGAGLLGRAMALTFARAGMDVVLADLDEHKAEQVAREVRALGRCALAAPCDVTDPASMAALADAAFREFGAVHWLVNNAGLAVLKPFEQLTHADWQRVLNVQLWGTLNGIQAFLPRLLAQGGDGRHIVNIASMSGVGLADMRQLNAPYVTAKFAVVGLSEVMAPSLAPQGVGVSVVCPGFAVADPTAIQEQHFLTPSAAFYRDNLLDGFAVAQSILQGVQAGRLHIFTHQAGRGEVEERTRRLLADFEPLPTPPGV